MKIVIQIIKKNCKNNLGIHLKIKNGKHCIFFKKLINVPDIPLIKFSKVSDKFCTRN